MGLFRNLGRELAVTTLLRQMEQGRFERAVKLLRRCHEGLVPPPHALWRLGRWCLDKSRPKPARQPLELFLRLYPGHQDRPEVMRDLARALALTGKRREAEELAAKAREMGEKRDHSRRDHRWRQRILAGRDKQFAPSGP